MRSPGRDSGRAGWSPTATQSNEKSSYLLRLLWYHKSFVNCSLYASFISTRAGHMHCDLHLGKRSSKRFNHRPSVRLKEQQTPSHSVSVFSDGHIPLDD